MNLAEQWSPAYKPSHKRLKPTRTQRSELSAKETARLYERSNRVCEKCDRARATGKAHIQRRWKSEGKPTAEDFAHLCTPCHSWCDSCTDGRQWLIDFQTKLMEAANNG